MYFSSFYKRFCKHIGIFVLFFGIAISGTFSTVNAGSSFNFEKSDSKRLDLRHPLLLIQAKEGPTLKEVLEEKKDELYYQKMETKREIEEIKDRIKPRIPFIALAGLGALRILVDGGLVVLFSEQAMKEEETEWERAEGIVRGTMGIDSLIDLLVLGFAGRLSEGEPSIAWELRIMSIGNLVKNSVLFLLVDSEAGKENPSSDKIDGLLTAHVVGNFLIPCLVGTGYEIYYSGLRRKLKSKQGDLEQIEQKLRDLSFYYNPKKRRWEIAYKIKF